MKKHAISLALAALLAGCGGPRAGGPTERMITRADVPDPGSPGAALVESNRLELDGDFAGAARVLLQVGGLENAAPVLRDARALRLARLSSLAPRFWDDASATWIPRAGESPWEQFFRESAAATNVLAVGDRIGSTDLPADVFGGAPSIWRTLGPLSSFGYAALESAPDLVDELSLPERVDLPGGTILTRLAVDGGQGVGVGGGAPGAYVAESWVTVEDAAEVFVAVWTAGRYLLEVDGEVVLRRGGDEAYASQLKGVAMQLEPGPHRVRVFVATTGAAVSTTLRVSRRDGGTPPQWSSDPFADLGRSAVIGETQTPLDAVAAATAPLSAERLAVAELAWWLGAGDLARVYRDLAEPADAAEWLWHGRTAQVLFQFAPAVRNTLAQQALEMAASGGAALAEVELAELLDSTGQTDAVAALADTMLARPAAPPVMSAWLGDHLGDWPALALPHLERAASGGAWDCGAIGAVVSAREQLDDTLDPATLPWGWEGCPAVVADVIERWWGPRGELGTALSEARRLAYRWPQSRSNWTRYADLARNAGDAESLLDARGGGAAWSGTPTLASLDEIDEIAALGGVASAGAGLLAHLSVSPSDVELRRALDFLLGRPWFEEQRIDGLAFVAQYLDEAPSYGGEVVYVLDHQYSRFLPDGSSIDVVHQIFQPLTRDALGEWGEQGIPEDAHLLTARTIKSDGRALAPEDIAGKDSISMPNLEAGDFIEIEWLRVEPAARVDRAVTMTPRFYFQTQGGTMHLSRVVYEYPEDWEDDVYIDLRNFYGVAAREAVDGLVRQTFTVHGVRPVLAEPAASYADEWLTSVRLVRGSTWSSVAAIYENLVSQRQTYDRTVRELSARLTAGHRRPCDAARAVFRHVNDEVVELGGFFSDPPSWAVNAVEGERLGLTWALLDAAGLDPQLVFIAPTDQDQTAVPYADSSIFEVTAIRVVDREDACWMEPEWDDYPFDYLRPEAQGRPAVITAGPDAGTTLTTPTWPVEAQTTRITMRIEVRPDGSAYATAAEALALSSSAGVRGFARTVEPDDLRREFEAGLVRSFPGVTVEDVGFDHLEDSDVGVGLRYAFSVPRFASRRPDGRWEISTAIYERSLAMAYASVATRTTPLLIDSPLLERLEIELVLPSGAQDVVTGDDEIYTHEGDRFERTYSVARETVTVRRATSIAAQRVAPVDYPGFAEFVRAASSNGRTRVEWTMP